MAKRFGRKVSEKIQTELSKPQPELPQYLTFYFQAFKDLARDRTAGFAPSAIPFTSILNYARHYRCDPETEDNLIYFVNIKHALCRVLFVMHKISEKIL